MAKGSKTGGGSRKGRPNKATAEVKAAALKYAPAALKELGRLSVEAENEATRVSAAKEILDRAYGKASQPIEHGVGDGLEALLGRISQIAGA